MSDCIERHALEKPRYNRITASKDAYCPRYFVLDDIKLEKLSRIKISEKRFYVRSLNALKDPTLGARKTHSFNLTIHQMFD